MKVTFQTYLMIVQLTLITFNLTALDKSLETSEIDYALMTDEGQKTKLINIHYYPADKDCCYYTCMGWLFKCKKRYILVYRIPLQINILATQLKKDIKLFLLNKKVFFPISGHLQFSADDRTNLEPNNLDAVVDLSNVETIIVEQIPVVD